MLTIGITGHQHFEGISDTSWLKRELFTRMAELENIALGYSSLAIGADVFFVEALLAMKIKMVAVIPCMNYDSTFSDSDLTLYQFLLNKANDKIILDFSHPDQEAFFEAGKYIAEYSNILFVLWDGDQAKGLGGTGDVFDYALKQNKAIIHINPWTEQTIIYNEN